MILKNFSRSRFSGEYRHEMAVMDDEYSHYHEDVRYESRNEHSVPDKKVIGRKTRVCHESRIGEPKYQQREILKGFEHRPYSVTERSVKINETSYHKAEEIHYESVVVVVLIYELDVKEYKDDIEHPEEPYASLFLSRQLFKRNGQF